MKREEFSELLGDINDNYIKEAHMKKTTSKKLWVKIGVAVACFGLVAAAIITLPNLTVKNDITDSSEITTDISVSTGDEMVASSSSDGDYPASIMVNDTIYYYTYEDIAESEINEEDIIGYTVSYSDTLPTQNGETNFLRDTGSPYVEYENGIALFFEGKWGLFEVKN